MYEYGKFLIKQDSGSLSLVFCKDTKKNGNHQLFVEESLFIYIRDSFLIVRLRGINPSLSAWQICQARSVLNEPCKNCFFCLQILTQSCKSNNCFAYEKFVPLHCR